MGKVAGSTLVTHSWDIWRLLRPRHPLTSQEVPPVRLFHSSLLAAALAVALSDATSSWAASVPPAARSTFRLFPDPQLFFGANRVGIQLRNTGEFLQGTQAAGVWPRGTSNTYLFAGGLQFAGLIRGTKPTNPWGGDTSGAMFFDASGTRKHGTALTPIYSGSNPVDVASWPDLALVPSGDPAAAFYDPTLQGRTNASDGDAYWITWDGDPALLTGRPHPLGLVVEHRVLGWNYPSGNADIIYLVATYYNVTSLRAADYAQHRPAMRTFLTQKAQDFHALNNARFGIALPEAGYAIDDLYAGWRNDPDVGTAGGNFASVNLPFALGFSWNAKFPQLANWRYDPELFGSPFFPGTGLLGVAFLGTATGPAAIWQYSNTCGSVCPTEPGSVSQLWRQFAGRFDVALGDPSCTISGPLSLTHVCFVHTTAVDVRNYQSAAGHTLLPGASATIVMALVHAAPVAIPGFTATAATNVRPGDPLRIGSVDSMAKYGGANQIDSIAGFLGFTDNGDRIPQAREFNLVPRSLLAKTRLAQQIFGNKFLLPSAPAAPAFTVTTANGTVTVSWQPSATEQSGDPYFAAASTSNRTGPSDPNAMYDPNFRRLDVEGYRLYRGRTDDPATLELVAQWDYAGTSFTDFGGSVIEGGLQPPTPDCAPELGRGTPPQCRVAFTPITPGVNASGSFAYPLNGALVQVDYGGRTLLATGNVLMLPGQVDTALTSRGFPALRDSGVPFTYVDQDVRSGVRYFYTVTAFDINSIRSGPSSMESPKVLTSVTVTGTTGSSGSDPLAQVHPVPDPYYAASSASASANGEVTFVNLPVGARLRIYSTSNRLIRVLDPPAGFAGGTMTWDLRDRGNTLVASGVYFYHVEAGGRSRIGRMTIVR